MTQELIVRIEKLEMMKFYEEVSGCCEKIFQFLVKQNQSENNSRK